jgi:hypothetical protein
MLGVVRWVLVPVVALFAWVVAFALGLVAYGALEAICPGEHVESGHCFAPWFETALYSLEASGAALAAMLVMLACTSVAPSHKPQVAIATFAVGTVVAIAMGWGRDWWAMAAAVSAGAITLLLLLRRRPNVLRPNILLQADRGR